MAKELYSKTSIEEISPYYKNKENIDKEKLKNSSTIYIGNLSFHTSETQLYQLFSFCGKIKRVIMGLNKINKKPCGFAFIEYMDKDSAKIAKNTLTGTLLDEEIIRVDIDVGFEEGRQYGRGKNGYQIRDELMKKYDPERPLKKNNGRQNNYGRNYNGSYNRYNERRNRSRSRSRSRSWNRNRSRSRSRSRNHQSHHYH